MKVLLVDDDADIRMIAALSLRHVGTWEVVTADSGIGALKLLETQRPDLILLDLMMPELDGIGTLTELRKREDCATIPVVFMTAKVQRSDLERYRAAGALGVVRKPFDPLTLVNDVRRILEEGGIKLP